MSRRWLALLVLTLGCPTGADERARLDTEVGRAAASGLRVEVKDGAAVVRSLRENEIVLWAGQPRLEIIITSDTPRSVELVVKNVMPSTVAREGLALRDGAVGTEKRLTVNANANAETRITLAPDDDESRVPFRMAMLADVQEAIDRVDDVYARMRADPKIKFVVFNGDQTRRGGRDELAEFERKLSLIAVPFFMTLGNHELGHTDGMYREVFGRGNHHFTYRGAHFTLLDSASATIDPTVYGWLDTWLAEGRDAVHLVSMHIPPFDPVGTRNGAFASRAEATKLVERFGRGRVDATYFGHVHSFYSYAIGSIPAFISGGGGAIPERMDGIGRNYLTVDIDPVAQTVETALVRVD